MADVEALLGARAHERSAPAASDAVAFTGGLGIAVGVLALTADFYAHGHGRWPGIALSLVLIFVIASADRTNATLLPSARRTPWSPSPAGNSHQLQVALAVG